MKNNKQFESFKTKRGEHVNMNQDEVARWCCLIEAVDIIDKKGSQIGMDMVKSNWVKPIAIQKYIDERTESMLFEVKDDLSQEKKA